MKYGNNTCQHCKREIDLQDFDTSLNIPKTMASKTLCFDCAFWYKLAGTNREFSTKGLPVITLSRYSTSASINQKYYWFMPFKLLDNTQNVEFHPVDLIQPKHKVLFNNGELYTVRELQAGLEIPTSWYPRFKVNARFLTDYEALKLISRKDTLINDNKLCYKINKEIVTKMFNED